MSTTPADNSLTVLSQLQQQLTAGLSGCEVRVSGDGGRYEVDAVGDCFVGVSRVRRQQLVYACIDGLIKSGAVHAVTIRAQTPAERGG